MMLIFYERGRTVIARVHSAFYRLVSSSRQDLPFCPPWWILAVGKMSFVVGLFWLPVVLLCPVSNKWVMIDSEWRRELLCFFLHQCLKSGCRSIFSLALSRQRAIKQNRSDRAR